MKRVFLVLFMLLAGLAALPAAETVRHTLRYKGEERTYYLYLPAEADPDTPLVLVLHGYGGKAEGYCPSMLEVAEKEGFAVCYPQGEKDSKGKTGWNVRYPAQEGLQRDDAAFVRHLVRHLQKTYGLSRKNVFYSGMSNGGEMAYLLAARYPDLFNAYASVAGLTMEWVWRELPPKKAVPLLEIHGTADKTSRWEGDPVNQYGWGRYVAVPAAIAQWAVTARCAYEQSDTLARLSETSHPVIRHRYIGGIPAWKNGPAVEVRLYEVVGGKHSWALSDMDTCQEIWDFFSQYLR